MIDFAQARRAMIDGQVRVNDVTDTAVIAAMLEIPREQFVPESRADLAYIDDDLCIREAGDGKPARYLMEPMVLAKLLQALALDATARVLDVGAGSGYAAAVLGRIAGSVTALEDDEDLIRRAGRDLAKAGVANVEVVKGALPAGWAGSAPYDAILIEGAVETVPQALFDQLKDGGRLGAVIRKDSSAKAILFVRTGDNISARRLFDAAIPSLPGFEAPKTFVF